MHYKCKIFNDLYYIGETDFFRRRFLKHLSDIKNFVPYYVYTCVSIHFNLSNHRNFNLCDKICFYIFDSNEKYNKHSRLNIENQLINLFLELNVKLINFDIPSKYNIQFK